MSLKEIADAMESGNVSFGIRQVLKQKKKSPKKKLKVFVSKDARDETISQLDEIGIEFEVLKGKEEIAKFLELDFESEVFLVK